ncbi:MAG: hypothetical protein ACFE8B_09065 [Candidatus Hermodarchaeota archaeon]
MLYNAFQVDWIFVDTVIIILLFLLLLAVKIFKSTHRWRLSFSNEALESHSFPKPFGNSESNNIKVKHCNLVRNSSLCKQYENYPLVLIIRKKFKKHLAKILTEGLSSYGFNIINLKLQIKFDLSLNNAYDVIKFLLSRIIDNFKNQDLIRNSDYIVLNLSRSVNPNREGVSDPNEIGYIAVNPRINKYNIGSLKEIFLNQLQYPQLFYIFSKRNFFILKNNDLKYVNNEIGGNIINMANLITLEKASRGFKYYETILLGIIIDIIENKLVKSTNHT